jgi:hypothetical protein
MAYTPPVAIPASPAAAMSHAAAEPAAGPIGVKPRRANKVGPWMLVVTSDEIQALFDRFEFDGNKKVWQVMVWRF